MEAKEKRDGDGDKDATSGIRSQALAFNPA